MEIRPFHIKHLASGGMITNYFCTSKCRHCLYNCGPHREKNYIDRRTAEANLKTIRSLGCSSIHIGGGEPMLRPNALGEVLACAALTGISIAYVETNSSWYTDAESAAKILTMLRMKGLSSLLVSISPLHNEFIPFAKVAGVIAACRDVGINVFPWVNDFVKDLIRFDIQRTHAIETLEKTFGGDYLKNVLKRYWVHMGGRALETFRPLVKRRSLQRILHENPGGCARELLDTSHFHIDLFGNYIPGLCSGLAMATQDLGKPISEQQYPVLTTLFAQGVNGIYKLASHAYNFVPSRSEYINKCDLCTEIRMVMIKNQPEKWPELRPVKFYVDEI